VCQYMIEQGAVSITAIRDIAALKIQVGVYCMYLYQDFLLSRERIKSLNVFDVFFF